MTPTTARSISLLLFISLLVAIASSVTAQPAAVPLLAAAPDAIDGCPVLPADNIWNVAVDTLPLDARSATYVATIGDSAPAHADFGSGMWDGGPIGIPYVTVPGNQPRVPISFYYPDESDPGPYPIPANAPIEGGPQASGDRHVLVVDRDNCILYEVYDATPVNNGASWSAGSGAIFDLRSNALRPETWTSADAAGLPILPGLVRYDEVLAGEIRHALRFTVPQTRRSYVWPARHFASTQTGLQYPPMGQRFRLKANYDISAFAPEMQTILRALKKYGMILADNGSAWFFSGAPDARWNDDNLHQFSRILGSAFEAVDVSSLMINPESGQARVAGTATATANSTATRTLTATSTRTSTATPTRTPTLTPIAAATSTRTQTATSTATRTATRSTTTTATLTGTRTQTTTATATLTPSPFRMWLPVIAKAGGCLSCAGQAQGNHGLIAETRSSGFIVARRVRFMPDISIVS